MPKKKILIPIIVIYVLLIVMGICYRLTAKNAEAQCTRFVLTSCTNGNCSCNSGWTRVTETRTSLGIGQYSDARYTAICAANDNP